MDSERYMTITVVEINESDNLNPPPFLLDGEVVVDGTIALLCVFAAIIYKIPFLHMCTVYKDSSVGCYDYRTLDRRKNGINLRQRKTTERICYIYIVIHSSSDSKHLITCFLADGARNNRC